MIASNNAGPTAAGANVGGRVLTSDGRGITNVVVTLTDSTGKTRTAVTSSFGYYRFTDVKAGASCVVSAQAKRCVFKRPTQFVNGSGDADAINFFAY